MVLERDRCAAPVVTARPIFRAVPVVVSFPVGYANAHVPIQKMLFNWTTGESSLIREDLKEFLSCNQKQLA